MSQHIGKNFRSQDSTISLEDHNPGCMKGIFHHFNHHKWHNVKKRLPHKRHGSGKHATVTGDRESIRTTSDAGEMEENSDSVMENSVVETKSADPSPSHKSSVKSRIKALIADEVSKRRGRHRRSSSCPVRTPLERTNSIHRLEPSDLELFPENTSKHDDLRSQERVHIGSLLDPERNNGSCKFCATMLTMNYLKQSELDKHRWQTHRDHSTSLQESKLFLDALDLLNVRKEVFLKILQDPSSSLAHHLSNRRTSNFRFGLTKSMSFPAIGSSDRRTVKQEHSLDKQENGSCPKEEDELLGCIQVSEELCKHLAISKHLYTENGIPEQFSREVEISDNASPSSANMLRKRHDSKAALKHFKNLRDKIKHVISERRREKHWIIMDAALHKIPYGHRVSKDVKEGAQVHQDRKAEKFGKHSPGSSCGSDQLGSDFGRSPQQRFKRTSSFNESLDRYTRLLEITFNREVKHHISERSRFRTTDTLSPVRSSPATLGRILSLPDLRSYSCFQIEDSPSTSSLDNSVRITEGNLSTGNVKFSEQIPLSLGAENDFQPSAVSESESQENFLDVGETFEEAFDFKTGESSSCNDLNLEPVQDSAPTPAGQKPVSENDSNYEDKIEPKNIAVSASEEKTVDIDALENQVKQFYRDLLHVQVDTKNETEFNYVKDVLELSGFSGNEILGKWHSEKHPLDPLVFDEVEGCLVAQPEYAKAEEGESCDYLLLFDLINEVLLHIYERSFCNWPMPLTCQSHIRMLPIGYHVLEEVWTEISWFLSWKPEFDQAMDDVVSRDLSKNDGWMNLQFDAECVGLELEDLIFDDLLAEMITA